MVQEQTSQGATFAGFPKPTKNFFHLPNIWTDIVAEIDNLAELKVVNYVARHTWGYHEYGIAKTISTDEFMHGRRRQDGSRMDKGTGLSKPSVIAGLKKAEEDGYLVCTVDSSDLGRVEKAYTLKMSPCDDTAMDESDVKDLYPVKMFDTARGGGKDVLPQMSKVFTPDVKDLDTRGKDPLHRSEKDTLERHFRKTPKKESDASASSSPTHDKNSVTHKKEVTTSGETHGSQLSTDVSGNPSALPDPHAVSDTTCAQQITPPAYSPTIPPNGEEETSHATNAHHRGTTTASGHLPAVPHSGNDGLEYSVPHSPVLPNTTNREGATEQVTPAGNAPTTVEGRAMPGKTTRGGGKGSRKGGVTPKPTGGKQLPLPVALTSSQQLVWDEWCKMPWFKGVPPKMQSNDQDHLNKLVAYKPDARSMLAVKNWATSRAVDKKGWFTTRGWSLYYLVQEYPKWLSLQDFSTEAHHTDQTTSSVSYKNMSKKDLIAYILALPTGMRAEDPKYKELTNCMMYLTAEEKRTVTLQRRQLQMQRRAEMAFATL